MKNYEDIVDASHARLLKINTVMSKVNIASKLRCSIRMISSYIKDKDTLGKARMSLVDKIEALYNEVVK